MDDYQHIPVGARLLRVHRGGEGTPIVYLRILTALRDEVRAADAA